MHFKISSIYEHLKIYIYIYEHLKIYESTNLEVGRSGIMRWWLVMVMVMVMVMVDGDGGDS